MASRFLFPERDQLQLMSYREWLGPDELVWTVIEVVESLDLSDVYARYEQPPGVGGRPAYDPTMMLTLLVFGYCEGKRSMRELEAACRRDVAYRAICGGMVPDHATIGRFRQGLDDVVESLFVQVLAACVERGLVKVGTVALDGTKMEAAASKAANVAAETLARLRVEAERILAEVDAANDPDEIEAAPEIAEPVGPARPAAAVEPAEPAGPAGPAAIVDPAAEPAAGDAGPAENAGSGGSVGDAGSGGWPLGRRRAAVEERLERIQRAEQELAAAQQRREEDQRRRGRQRRGAAAVNMTDPESRLQPDLPGFLQGYNGQVVVSGDQIVIAAAVTADTTDVGMLGPMLEGVGANLAQAGVTDPMGTLLADCGYWSADNFALEDHIEGTLLIATTKGHQVGEVTPIDPATASPKAEARHRMQTRLAEHQDRYRQRNWMVEGTFAHTKTRRNIHRFQRRGLTACTAEWFLIHLAGNINKIHRHRTTGSGSTPPPPAPTGPIRPRHHEPHNHRNHPTHRHRPRHHPPHPHHQRRQ